MTSEKITIINATPAMADVISGAVPRPHKMAQGDTWAEWMQNAPAIQQMGLKGRLFEPWPYFDLVSDLIEAMGIQIDEFEDDDIDLNNAHLIYVKNGDAPAMVTVIALNTDGTRAAYRQEHLPVHSEPLPNICARCGNPGWWSTGAGEYLCLDHRNDY